MINNRQQLYNRLIKLCKSNKNGFTASQKAEILSIKKGYAVSLTNNKNMDIKRLVKTAIQLSKSFKNINNYCFGGWYDSIDKQYYLDISIIEHNRNHALHIAKLFNQKAIFNFNKFTSINVQ